MASLMSRSPIGRDDGDDILLVGAAEVKVNENQLVPSSSQLACGCVLTTVSLVRSLADTCFWQKVLLWSVDCVKR